MAIQAFGIDTLVDPISQMIAKGIPVIQMDTTISKDDIGITTFLEPDNIYMVSRRGRSDLPTDRRQGQSDHDRRGAWSHRGPGARPCGFNQALAKYPDIEVLAEDPADLDVNKVATLWEDYLVQFDDIQAGFFHNDDMALAAYNVINKNAGREKDIVLGGVDAMPPALDAARRWPAAHLGAQSLLHPLGRA